MLRYGPSVFAGNAGYRLPLPASFPASLPLGEQPPEGQWQHRAEVQIARKLQCIADQFHRLHVQQVGMRVGKGFEAAGVGKPGPAFVLLSAVQGLSGLRICFRALALANVITMDWVGTIR